MNTLGDTAPLSFFIPGNLSADLEDEKLVSGISSLSDLDNPKEVSHKLLEQAADRWGTAYSSDNNLYDRYHLPLELAVKTKRFDCLTSTALICLAGRLIEGYTFVPAIQMNTRATNRYRSLHGFTAFSGNGWRWYKVDDSIHAAGVEFNQTANLIEDRIQRKPWLLSGSGIVQVGLISDTETYVRSDEETTIPHPRGRTETYTLFPGEEGLKSYMNTIEKISARTNGRTPNTHPDQPIPRL